MPGSRKALFRVPGSKAAIRCLFPAILILGLGPACFAGRAEDAPPPPKREFRGVWVASVVNIDWPSKPGLSRSDQQREFLSLLDWTRQLHLNAVILQVRPSCDALYPSPYEPWCEFLSGTMGQPPEPYYDPLRFAIAEAHRRGLELHAWFNPFRARHHSAKSPIAPNHISRLRPDLVRKYDGHLWLDPGEPAVQAHTLRVILDVVKRYNIDGVHLDDYFYPYRNAQGDDFPDDPSWQDYLNGGGTLDRADWRRQNVDHFVAKVYREIKQRKPWVKFGISPFGIWRPGFPPQIRGKDAYAELYANSFKWFANGWLDYFSPQLYWKIDAPGQAYPVLLSWWAAQNFQDRHLWPGNNVSNIDYGEWKPEEIVRQIQITRRVPKATGNVLFSARSLINHTNGLAEALLRHCYQEPALIPASPWLSRKHPLPPELHVQNDPQRKMLLLEWRPAKSEKEVWLWTFQTQRRSQWTTEILPGNQYRRLFPLDSPKLLPTRIAVSAVNRYGQASPPRILVLK